MDLQARIHKNLQDIIAHGGATASSWIDFVKSYRAEVDPEMSWKQALEDAAPIWRNVKEMETGEHSEPHQKKFTKAQKKFSKKIGRGGDGDGMYGGVLAGGKSKKSDATPMDHYHRKLAKYKAKHPELSHKKAVKMFAPIYEFIKK